MIREVKEIEKGEFNKLASHPLQSWEWGEFRKKTGLKVTRLGRFLDDKRLMETALVTWHKLPKLPWCVGYWPKGVMPSDEMMEMIKEEAKKHKAIFVKMEPSILVNKTGSLIEEWKDKWQLVVGTSLFTKWSFWLDLTKTEEDLMKEMKPKTRYNVRYAERKGVKVVEDNSELAFDEYWKLTQETTKRQRFYAHSRKYHELMFETLQTSGMAHLFRAVYKKKTLTTWIVFLLNETIYYPYGASSREMNNVYPSDAMMWHVIKWGKTNRAKIFDLWGSAGPNAGPDHPWAGFRRFKEGYGAEEVEFVGTFDLVINPILYRIYQTGNGLRWLWLRLKRKV